MNADYGSSKLNSVTAWLFSNAMRGPPYPRKELSKRILEFV